MSQISSSILAIATSNWGFFMPPNLAPPNASYDVSIINLCGGSTGTYAIKCTAGGAFSSMPLATCGPNAPVLTVTEDMTFFTFATQTTISNVATSISETCALVDEGNTASCVASYEISTSGGTATTSMTTPMLTNGAQVTDYLFPINITGGALKMINGSLNTCSGAERDLSLNGVLLTTSVVLLGVLGVMFT